MRMDGRRSYVVVLLAWLCPAWIGCVGLVGFDTAILGSLISEKDFLGLPSGGNIAISCTNRTSRSVTWTVTWQAPGADQPMVFNTQTDPNGTTSVCVEGAVERITLGSEETDAPAVVLDIGSNEPTFVPYEGKPLVFGEDFRPGDIVSFTIVASASGQYTITTEIVSGG